LTAVIVFGERHLCDLLHSRQVYYNEVHTHLPPPTNILGSMPIIIESKMAPRDTDLRNCETLSCS